MESFIDSFRDAGEKKSDIVITVDGKAGAGKGTLAEHIADKLGIEHFSASDVFYAIAEERGLEDVELSEEAEKEVDLEVDRKTLERALSQDCVIDSRIASWVLGSYADFRIRLVADVEERGRRLASRDGLDEEEAVERVKKRDEGDARRYKQYYGIDLDDLEIYDLLIDNTDLGIEEQNRLVDKVLEKRFPDRL